MTPEKICERRQSELITTTGLGAVTGLVGAKIARLFFGHAIFPLTKHLVLHGAIAGCVGMMAAVALEFFRCINLNKQHEVKTIAAYAISVIAILPLYSAGVALTVKSALLITAVHAIGTTVVVGFSILLYPHIKNATEPPR